MSRPTTLPGLLGALAGLLGVSGLSNALGTNPRTLHNWATNKSAMPAVEAGLLADLAKVHGVMPMLYTHPGLPTGYLASTHEGWLMFGARLGGWAQRSRYRGHTEGLVPVDAAVLLCARGHGWPW